MRRMCAVLLGIAVSAHGLGCFTKAQRAAQPPQFRTLQVQQATRFHKKIMLEIGWYPYQREQAVAAGTNLWTIVHSDSGGVEGALPVILVSYPDSSEAVWLDLNIDDALLGRLLKHSLMTEIPIKRPLAEFLQEANCGSCHPAEIRIRE